MMVCFFTLSGVAFAQERGRPKGGMDLPRGQWWNLPEVVQEFNISSDEQAKLDDLFFNHRNQEIDLKGTVRKEQLQLERVIEKDKLDETACKNQFQKVLIAQNNVAAERFNFLIDVRKILGYERFQQLTVKFKEKRIQRPGQYDGKGRPGRKR